MKILHISKYYMPFIGGIEQTARDLVLSLRGVAEQKLICFDHRPHSGDSVDRIDSVEVIRCGQQLLVASQALSLSYGRKLRSLMREFRPDVVLFHYPNPFVAHYLLRELPPETKLLIYWHLDITKQKLLRRFFSGQNRRLLERADRVIATSPNYIEGSVWLRAFREKCTVIESCINEERLRMSEGERERAAELRKKNTGKILCLAVGRHVPYKGYEYLIRAFRLLDDRFLLRIAGKGPLTEELKREAEGDEKVRFLGAVPDEELRENLLACDIYCFPSVTKNEAFGLSLAEGMYFGHPAVTFTIEGSGVNYVCPDKLCGLEVPNGDIAAYAEALKKLAEDPKLREELGENARARVTERFLYRSFAEKIRALLTEL